MIVLKGVGVGLHSSSFSIVLGLSVSIGLSRVYFLVFSWHPYNLVALAVVGLLLKLLLISFLILTISRLDC